MAYDTRYSVINKMGITSEKLLSWIWQHQYLKPGLTTTEGKVLKVIFPGRRNGLGGPDFRHAILATRRGELRGDVELHLRSSLWHDHGHQRDPAYNSVILHVVMWHDSPVPVCLSNGNHVPTVSLALYVMKQEQSRKPPAREPCRQPGRRPETPTLGQFLDKQGKARFMARAARFRDRFRQEAPAQVLYEGIMEALGYSRNQEAFKELAKRLPLKEAESVVRVGGREGIYNLLSLNGIHWQQQGVRPGNQPARRLLALSYLLEQYSVAGLLPGLMDAVERAARAPIYRRRELEASLIVGVPEGRAPIIKGKRESALLGRERAGEIAVNILLPFACAHGLESQALGLYRGYPPLAENEITREMSELLGTGRKLVNSACRQQGLIHLFKLFCADRRCQECPLGDSEGL